MFKAEEKQSVADSVYTQLRGRILKGELEAGAALPGERKLSEQFGVNRGAVREAIRRLAHARLVSVQHGGATRVLDYRKAGLDLLVELVEVHGIASFTLDVLELRDTLAPLVARLAAERGGAKAAEALAPVVRLIEEASEADRYSYIRAFWRILAEQADNLPLRLALNSLQVGSAAQIQATTLVLKAEIAAVGAYRKIADAIAVGDGDAAAAAVVTLVASTMQHARQLMGALTAS